MLDLPLCNLQVTCFPYYMLHITCGVLILHDTGNMLLHVTCRMLCVFGSINTASEIRFTTPSFIPSTTLIQQTSSHPRTLQHFSAVTPLLSLLSSTNRIMGMPHLCLYCMSWIINRFLQHFHPSRMLAPGQMEVHLKAVKPRTDSGQLTYQIQMRWTVNHLPNSPDSY